MLSSVERASLKSFTFAPAGAIPSGAPPPPRSRAWRRRRAALVARTPRTHRSWLTHGSAVVEPVEDDEVEWRSDEPGVFGLNWEMNSGNRGQGTPAPCRRRRDGCAKCCRGE